MEKIKIAYFGSPDFAAYFLEKLLTDTTINQLIEVKLIITQKDKLVGRKQILTPTPVKLIANKYGIKSKILNHKSQINNKLKIIDSKNLEFNNLDLFGAWNLEFSALKDIDLALVYAYGDLIPKELLEEPKYGFWNIHPSLLPKYRGPSPIATPLINGDKITGVTIIKMDEEIDHGPIIAQESLTIEKNDKRPDLEKKLTELGFEMFKKIIKNVILGSEATQARMTTIPQNHNEASYTKKLFKNDGFIEFKNLRNLIKLTTNHQSLATFYNLYRALCPWPGIWTIIPDKPHFAKASRGKRLKITDLSLIDGKLIINKVQLEGKNETDFETFNKAYKIF